MPSLLIDGLPATALSAHDRGLQFGHGLFETMRLWQSEIPLLERHLVRLARGAQVLGIPCKQHTIRRYLNAALAQFPANGIVKLLLTAGAGQRGYRYAPDAGGEQPRCLLYFFERPSHLAGVALQVCDYRLPRNPRLAGIKHLNRLDQVLAAAELAEGKEGLLLDSSGNVIEALSSNVFLYCQGQWLSPRLDKAGVAGVMREVLLEQVLPALGENAHCREVAAGELVSADEIFICNAVRGIIPVESISGEVEWSRRRGVTLGDNSRDLQVELNRLYPCFGG